VKNGIIKIYPKKIGLIIFILFFIFIISLWIYIFISLKEFIKTIDFLIYGIPIPFLMSGFTFLHYRIIIKEHELIIKEDGKKGYKKIIIQVDEIVQLECLRYNLIGSKVRMNDYKIYYMKDQQEVLYVFNDSIYNLNDLTKLFKHLETTYQIPFSDQIE